MATQRQRYPRRAVIERMIATARASGIKVDGFEVGPSGNIRILAGGPMALPSAYETWKARGK